MTPADEEALAREVVDKGRAEIVALTLGGQGAVLATWEGVLRLPSPKVESRSAVVLGDAFLGAMVWGLANGRKIDEAFALAVLRRCRHGHDARYRLGRRAQLEQPCREYRHPPQDTARGLLGPDVQPVRSSPSASSATVGHLAELAVMHAAPGRRRGVHQLALPTHDGNIGVGERHQYAPLPAPRAGSGASSQKPRKEMPRSVATRSMAWRSRRGRRPRRRPRCARPGAGPRARQHAAVDPLRHLAAVGLGGKRSVGRARAAACGQRLRRTIAPGIAPTRGATTAATLDLPVPERPPIATSITGEGSRAARAKPR